jgi:hypothetical protein
MKYIVIAVLAYVGWISGIIPLFLVLNGMLLMSLGGL